MSVAEPLSGSWIGLPSPLTVAFVMGMAAHLFVFVTRHMKEPGKQSDGSE